MTQGAADCRRGRATRKDNIIRIRVAVGIKTMLNLAATLRGQKLSEFMLDSARRQAEDTIVDRRGFCLDAETHERFLKMFDAPTIPSQDLRARMNRRPSWER
jgi:uncharacterized protein (DUF1778 family)